MGDQPDTTKQNLEIRLADRFEPRLTGGAHVIKAVQSLKTSTESYPFEAEKTIFVSAPRFALNAGDIYSVHPPAGQTGSFRDTLPHIVFTRKTLPWERGINAKAGAGGSKAVAGLPWMALLTLDDDEMMLGDGTSAKNVRLHSVPLSEVYKPPEGVCGPELVSEPGERADPNAKEPDRCLVADMETSFFRDIAPTLEDLFYLAHARQVESEDKDVADAVTDGWFSVVIGNRLPQEGRNHAVLVSLEGHQRILKGERNEDSRLPHLPAIARFVVLKLWDYISEGLTFDKLLDGLTEGKDGGDKDVWLRVSPGNEGAPPGNEGAPSGNEEAPHEAVRRALALGYTALHHSTRQGGQTVSWYRGPLIPIPFEPSWYQPIHENADAALRYDAATGLFDVSYAAAWQLGRLLALQTSGFAASLLDRRSDCVAQEVLAEAGRTLKDRHGDDGAIDGQRAKLLLQDDLMIAILTEWWLSETANVDENG